MEIERNAGTQFHPAVAKAFEPFQRGIDPINVLSSDELAEIRGASAPYTLGVGGFGELTERPELVALGGVVLALAGLAFGQDWLASAGVGLAVVAPGIELGREGVAVALPLRRDNSALVGFLVVTAPKLPPRHVELALLDSLDETGLALAARPQLDGSRSQSAEPLETAADPRDFVLARLDER